MSIFLAEFFGTFLLILLGNGVTANVTLPKTKGENSGWIVVTFGWAMAVVIGIYLVGWVSGAHLNPAISLAMALAGKITWSYFPWYLSGQFLGAFLGAYFVFLFYKDHFDSDKDSSYKLMAFATKPQINNKFANFISEVIATFILIITVFSVTDEHNMVPAGIGPIVVGFIILSIGLSLGGTTGYAINPFRDFCPRLVHQIVSFKGKGKSEWNYSWIPFCAPFLGGLIGYIFYYSIFLKFVSN